MFCESCLIFQKQLETGSSSKATKEGYLFLMEKSEFT